MRKKYVEHLLIYGTDLLGTVWCELDIKIDWSRHEFHMAAGRTTVGIDSRWRDGAAIEVDEAVDLFEKCMAARGLSPKVMYRYPAGADVQTIRKELGTGPGDPVKWAGVAEGPQMRVSGLDEVSAGIRIFLD
ncbi:hypothetical protein [Streptomyces sp. NPDC049915]|uniref:hypothetical protein n=1 Tax=Streptomyces sp. NPDC049915 TaxID=3155510 RepID=UPI003448E4CB